MEVKSFPAKILLFGEYTIINGGSALAIPFWKYSGQWQHTERGRNLNDFYAYLETIEGSDIVAIETARAKDQTYNSTIPLGYGLGSSGSLSAAAFDLFFPAKSENLDSTRHTLAEIESFFHGNSSGMDPLACYYQKAVHVRDGQITLRDDLTLPKNLKLLDSHKNRVSKPLIEHFKIRVESDDFYEAEITALSKFNDRIIEELLIGRDISSSFREISRLQLELFIRMIPTKLRDLWKEGLATDKFYLKLSGAGGGGYFLVYEVEEGSVEGLEELS